MTPSLALSHPNQLTPLIFEQVLTGLQAELKSLQEEFTVTFSDWIPLRIRDWHLIIELGNVTAQIFLDKDPSPPLGHPSINIDTCVTIHRAFEEKNIFKKFFRDDVAIEMSSPGAEPALRSLEDFQQAKGVIVSIETWPEFASRKKYVMLLGEVDCSGPEPLVVLAEGSAFYRVPLASVKKAQALVFHPLSQAFLGGGDGPKRKNARPRQMSNLKSK